MAPKSNKFWALLYAIAICLALILGGGTYVQHVTQLRSKIESTFQSRSELLTKFVALQRDRVLVMRNLIVERFQASYTHSESRLQIREHPKQKIWELVTDPSQVAGTLTGNSQLPLTDELRHEIRAALGIDAQIRATRQFDAEVVWLYYLSANGFIYIAPQAPIDRFHFKPELYRQRYWLEAIPQFNQEHRMILAGPYQDLAGKGWIMTFAAPVYAGERFLGIVALDLRIDTMQQLTNIGEALGESMLISENDRLIARQSGFEPEARLHPPVSDKLIDWREDESRDLWLSSPVVKDELWLVHRLKFGELYWTAARESAATWLMIVLIGLLGIIAWRLKDALAKVTRMTNFDPLTQVLNRRGFYEKAETAVALGQRKNFSIAVLMMDIDFFKKINDTYGHSIGDSVLKQLGGYVLQASRPFDLVCRWGGEEFVLVLLLDRPAEAAPVAERMRQEAQRTRIQPGDVPVALSGGLVLMRQGESMDDAIKRADILLYQAKRDGRDRIVSDL